ncbi:MAG: hypothetical protein ACKPKO_59515, partial [Candidatus Fonsibacter sp.]
MPKYAKQPPTSRPKATSTKTDATLIHHHLARVQPPEKVPPELANEATPPPKSHTGSAVAGPEYHLKRRVSSRNPSQIEHALDVLEQQPPQPQWLRPGPGAPPRARPPDPPDGVNLEPKM